MKNLPVSSLARLLSCAALQQAEPGDQLKLLSSTLGQSERQKHHNTVAIAQSTMRIVKWKRGTTDCMFKIMWHSANT